MVVIVTATTTTHVPHHSIPHEEVGIVVGIFLMAIVCLAWSMTNSNPREMLDCCWPCNRRRRNDGDDDDDNDDDEESYIDNDDDDAGRVPAPHVFESLNEFVFFEAPDGDGDNDDGTAAGFLATPIKSRNRSNNNNDPNDSNISDDDDNNYNHNNNMLPTTKTMAQIFPDVLGTSASGGGANNNNNNNNSDIEEGGVDGNNASSAELREPLL